MILIMYVCIHLTCVNPYYISICVNMSDNTDTLYIICNICLKDEVCITRLFKNGPNRKICIIQLSTQSNQYYIDTTNS